MLVNTSENLFADCTFDLTSVGAKEHYSLTRRSSGHYLLGYCELYKIRSVLFEKAS